jgi:hypothetical protein
MKIKKKKPVPEYYNNEVKWFKAKVRRAHNKRKIEQRYQVEMKKLQKTDGSQKTAQEIFLQSVL